MGTERDPLAKAVQLLTLIAENGGAERSWGVRELGAALDVAPSGVHRLLTALGEHGWIERDDGGQGYRLGFEFMRLSFLISGDNPLPRLARPIMHELVREVDETVLLGVLDPVRMEMIFAASVESRQPLRYVIELNRWQPIHFSASGLAIFAFMSQEKREAHLNSGPLAGANETTITDPDAIRAAVARIRERGAAISTGQRLSDAVGIAAPIFGADDNVLGDLCITVPKQRFDAQRDEARLIEAVKRHAGAITAALRAKSGNSS